MKKLSALFGLLLFLSFSISFANEIELKKYEDLLCLKGGNVIKGEIIHFGRDSFKIESAEGTITKIKNADVILVAIAQEMSSQEKYQLGILDGKRFAIHKGGNFALGFASVFTGYGIFVAPVVVYLTSDQAPGLEAKYGPNKAIIDDKDYVEGYSKGARSKSFSQTLIGIGTGFGAALLIVASIFGALMGG